MLGETGGNQFTFFLVNRKKVLIQVCTLSDVVNRLAWAELGNITSDQAKEKFIKFLEESCPLFKPFIEAHQKEKEERQKLKNCQSNGSISSHPIGGKDLDLSDRTSGNPPLVDKFISSLDSLTEEQK